MNYLAHTLLSKNTIDYQLGNLLADLLKGQAWQGSRQGHIDGLSMHKKIDKFTDNSPIVKRAVERLGKGYLKGVVLDITFDYFLSKHWDKFVKIDKTDFVQKFYQNAECQQHELPKNADDFIGGIIKYNILDNYNTLVDLEQVFYRVNRRLSPRLLSKESTTDYLPRITANYDDLEDDFLEFFPTLMAMFTQSPDIDNSEHFLCFD